MRNCIELGICASRPIRCYSCPMRSVLTRQQAQTQRIVSDALPELLHPACPERPSEQAAGSGNAGSDQAVAVTTWPGKDIGVRAPDAGETPLSMAEVAVGVKLGLWLDPLGEVDVSPIRRRIRPAGTWVSEFETNAPRSVFDGLVK